MKIFVIIVTYKGQRWYDKCFSSLRESTIPIQTIVIDNTPGDEDATYIKEHFPEVHLIKTKENLGFGRANNIGMRFALDQGCDYAFLLNQDTWIEPDSIAKLVAVAENHPEYGIISPVHLNAEKTKLNMQIGLGSRFRNEELLSDLYCQNIQDIYETNYVNAAAWLLPRNTLEVVGGFDPIFKQYEEDDNYLNRTIFHGLKIGVCPFARIIHDHIDSELSNDKLLIRQQQFLLVEWTNINKPFSMWHQTRYCIRKWLSYICAGKWSQAKFKMESLLYCRKMYDAVIKSRKENQKEQASWLLAYGENDKDHMGDNERKKNT